MYNRDSLESAAKDRERGASGGGDAQILDCEVRDWERFGILPLSIQEAVLEAIAAGKVPRSLLALMARLRDAGIVICT